MEGIGCEVSLQEVLPGRPNVVARLEGRMQHRALLLEAHLDTVEVEGMVVEPFEGQVGDGRLYGRGSADAKGSLAAFMLAMQRLASVGVAPAVSVVLGATIDEEHHYRGVLQLLEDLKDHSDFVGAVVGEPTELKVVVAHKGSVRFRVTAAGRSSHSSQPWNGENAIDTMAEVVVHIRDHLAPRLAELEHPLVGPPSLCTTLISGGTGVNIVPQTCTIYVDRRTVPGEVPEDVWRDYKTTLEALRPGKIQLPEPDLLDFPLETDPRVDVVQRLSASLASVGVTPEVVGVTYGTDASKIARAGIPAVVFGPGSIRDAHRPDESIDLAEVQIAVEAITQLAKLFGGET